MAAKKPWADLLEGPGKPGSKRAASTESTGSEPSPTTVYMHTVTGSPENPRTEADYTDDDTDFRDLKESMRSVGQLQPAVAMSREAFLRAKPEHGNRVGDAEWIIILGNRRLHAAKQLGWTKFEIRVRDRLGREDDDKIDEAVIIENIHRKNIPPYKEAQFLQRMIERHGSQEKVAERIGKSQMYVSNRLSLLNLTPELQDAVDTKQLKVKTAEQISKIEDPEQQKARAAEEILKASQPRRPRKSASVAPERPQLQNPVLNSVPEGEEAHRGSTDPTPVQEEALAETRAPAPAPALASRPSAPATPAASAAAVAPAAPAQATGGAQQAGPGSSQNDGVALMEAAFANLDPAQRSAFILHYFKVSRGVDHVIADMRGNLTSRERSSLAAILQQVAASLLKDG